MSLQQQKLGGIVSCHPIPVHVTPVVTDIPAPEEQSVSFPFDEMPVGGSFWAGTSRSHVSVAACRYGKANGLSFIVRKEIAEQGQVGFRVWRVA